MTPKEYVISKYPNAKAEKNYDFGKAYKHHWIIRNGYSYEFFSTGKTESEAWENSKKLIEENFS